MKSKPFQKTYFFLTALLCASCMHPAKPVSAFDSAGSYGDPDQDGTVSVSDAVMLEKHLTAETALEDQSAAECADLNHDGKLNAVDLTLLKRQILQGTPGPGDQLITKPLSVLSPTLPSTGNVRILLVLVNFSDCVHPDKVNIENVQAQCFGAADPDNWLSPLESITAFYERASYGRLHVDGDVYEYTVQGSVSKYIDRNKLADEVLAGLDDQIDYTNYDANQDGILDAVIFAVPQKADSTEWRAKTGRYFGKNTHDGIKIGSRTSGRHDPTDRAGFSQVWIHELGHAMGLPDYYKYFNTEDGIFGLNGDAGWEMMDDAGGDFSSFSKLMLGWYTASEIQIYSGGTQTFQLASSQTTPGCVIIPRNAQDGFCSEYFVLEYLTNEQNNRAYFDNLRKRTMFSEGGLRVLHCDAEICEGVLGNPELKWNNYGKYYDDSNTKQRVLRLVNEAEGGTFFRTGDTVSDAVSGFHWYDDDGGQTVPTGCTVTVQSIEDGICTFTIS